jgi:hypothetical protein
MKESLKLERVILRLGLLAAGLMLVNVGADLWLQSPLAASLTFGLALSFVAWSFGSGLLILALTANLNPRWVWAILVASLLAQTAYVYLARLNYTPLTASHTDNEMVAEYAAQALKQGQNPYQWNYGDTLRAYRDRGGLLTPWLDGSSQSRLTYPALPTLLLWGLDQVGLGQPRTVTLFFHFLLLVLLFLGAPPLLRPVALWPLLFKLFVNLNLNGVQDVVWSTLLVGMILAWRRATWRAVLFGLACAFRQQPWFLVPFLLIQLWHEPGEAAERRHRAIYFAGFSLGVFIIINLPFILWDFRAWVGGVFEPLYAQFNFYSQGLAIVSQLGWAPLPRQFYTLLQASSLFLMILIHWRHPRRIGQAFWIFPAIFFWLYYRGLSNYWLYWIPPLLAAASRFVSETVPALEEPLYRRRTMDIVVVMLAVNLFVGAVFSGLPPTIEVNLFLPMETVFTGQPVVSRFKLAVTNHSQQIISPRFAVQGDSGAQPLPWKIELGPDRLAPGQSADYVIKTGSTGRAFAASRGGLVVVTDAATDFLLRTTTAIPADPTFANPDQIVNPKFYFWGNGTNAPEGWGLHLPEGVTGLALVQTMDDHVAVNLSAQTTTGPVSVRLRQTITFPGSFAIWLYPARSVNANAYGLEFNDGTHTVRVLYGAAAEKVVADGVQATVTRSAPLDKWSRQTIDLPKLYAELGWELPPFSIRKRNGVVYRARQIDLSLLVDDSQNTASAWFGSIEQGKLNLESETLTHPDVYYANLAGAYCHQRNYDLAALAYQQAQTYNPQVLAPCQKP